MARPRKYNADYFRYDSYFSEREEVAILVSLMGHTGFFIYVRMLELLTRQDFFELDLSKKYTKDFIIKKIDCEKEDLEKFLKIAFELGLLKKRENGKTYSPYLHTVLEPLIKKRENDRNYNTDDEI